VSAIQWGIRENLVRPLVVSDGCLGILEDRLVLSYTGISHFSGATNWDMLRNYIENTGSTRTFLRTIGETAHAMADVLEREDWDGFARVLDQEWRNRRGLAEGVSTPEIDGMISAAAEAGALASKLCGAGGGGCMITFAAPGRSDAVRSALTTAGATVMPYRISRDGLQVKRVEQ
jgi:D-glycero-alpha-D-manno-heptose-7-phosphate kinase